MTDFEGIPVTLTFSSTKSRVCFDIHIIDDKEYELRQTFLANLTTSDNQVIISPNYASLGILDNESK